MGGPRVGGYAAQHPEKVRKLVLLAPAYNRGTAEQPPVPLPAAGPAMNIQSHDEWERNHLVLFRASLEWLVGGTVNGLEQETLHLGN
jgi:pimeloyl-ACP methyl ester carboxylesterase